ncbi:unnamed protein product [Microthlaspi erraticum]|uniref:Uncharacterized protein n=1 Tax=Microthlaspi erraticum TaxID=1685480 RepID=A0A6D2HR67_9BRAS|nr:unnamed protein product [Microthlaspi erraticum]
MWVLGLHEVHGEESIVVLLVHGELSSSSALVAQPPPWFILVPSCSSSSTNWFTSSPFFTLSLITPSSFGDHFPPLEQDCLLRVDISLCIRFFHPLPSSDPSSQIGLHLKPSFPCIA